MSPTSKSPLSPMGPKNDDFKHLNVSNFNNSQILKQNTSISKPSSGSSQRPKSSNV